MRGRATRRSARFAPAAAISGLLALLLAIGLWNARTYPPGRGYDAGHHLAYADLLIHEGRLPHRVSGPSEVDTPPAYYLLAGSGWWLGERIGLGEPRRVSLAFNVLMVLATGGLVVGLGRLLFPDRRWLWVSALAYFVFLPVVTKTEAMFHPENLNLLLSTAALYLGSRMLIRRSFTFPEAAAVGVVIGLDLLTRKAALFAFAAILLGLGLVAVLERRPRALRSALVVLVIGAALYAPWWVHAHNLRPAPPLPPNTPPVLQASFLGPAVPAAFTTPWRPHFTNRVFPMTYTETWGDFFGAFAWTPPPPPTTPAARQLQAQAALGIVPTILAFAGWLLLLTLALTRRRALLAVALLPGIALAGFLWYTAHALAPDGDVIKATYLVVTAPAWALSFAYALGRLPRPAALGLGVLLAVSALVDLRFLLYGNPLGFL